MNKFVLHPEAYLDLEGIWNFIAKDSPVAADRVREKIYSTIRNLIRFPHQGHTRTDLASPRLRFVTVFDYLIAYAPEENPLLVVAVVHGRRNPKLIARVLKGRL